jgi:hypothetical protein
MTARSRAAAVAFGLVTSLSVAAACAPSVPAAGPRRFGGPLARLIAPGPPTRFECDATDAASPEDAHYECQEPNAPDRFVESFSLDARGRVLTNSRTWSIRQRNGRPDLAAVADSVSRRLGAAEECALKLERFYQWSGGDWVARLHDAVELDSALVVRLDAHVVSQTVPRCSGFDVAG